MYFSKGPNHWFLMKLFTAFYNLFPLYGDAMGICGSFSDQTSNSISRVPKKFKMAAKMAGVFVKYAIFLFIPFFIYEYQTFKTDFVILTAKPHTLHTLLKLNTKKCESRSKWLYFISSKYKNSIKMSFFTKHLHLLNVLTNTVTFNSGILVIFLKATILKSILISHASFLREKTMLCKTNTIFLEKLHFKSFLTKTQ